jgi:hypothetical protein
MKPSHHSVAGPRGQCDATAAMALTIWLHGPVARQDMLPFVIKGMDELSTLMFIFFHTPRKST